MWRFAVSGKSSTCSRRIVKRRVPFYVPVNEWGARHPKRGRPIFLQARDKNGAVTAERISKMPSSFVATALRAASGCGASMETLLSPLRGFHP